jgi:hypothetical protein
MPPTLGEMEKRLSLDDQQVLLEAAGVVEALVGQAAGHGAVAHHRHHVVILTRQIARRREAERRRDGGRAVRRAEDVVGALDAAREAGDAAVLAQRGEAVASPGEDLVGVRLVADVPHDAVARRVEDRVQGQRQLHRPEARGQVPAILRAGVHDQLADLFRQAGQGFRWELLEVLRAVNPVQKCHSVPRW